MNFLNTLLGINTAMAEAAANATGVPSEEVGGIVSLIVSMLPMVLIFVVFYFFMIRPQKKKEKEANEMRNSLQIGDTVTTIGGITGIVNSLHEDEFILETSNDRTKICFKRWAIQEVKKLEL